VSAGRVGRTAGRPPAPLPTTTQAAHPHHYGTAPAAYHTICPIASGPSTTALATKPAYRRLHSLSPAPSPLPPATAFRTRASHFLPAPYCCLPLAGREQVRALRPCHHTHVWEPTAGRCRLRAWRSSSRYHHRCGKAERKVRLCAGALFDAINVSNVVSRRESMTVAAQMRRARLRGTRANTADKHRLCFPFSTPSITPSTYKHKHGGKNFAWKEPYICTSATRMAA